jgi:hypothetical protein
MLLPKLQDGWELLQSTEGCHRALDQGFILTLFYWKFAILVKMRERYLSI